MNDRTMSRRSAFTLIELLVSISILLVVGLAVAGTVAAAVNVWERAAGYDRQRTATLLGLAEIEREIRNMIPCYAISFKGNRTSMAFCMPGETPGEPFTVVEYRFVESDRSIKRSALPYPRAGVMPPEFETVLHDVEMAEFTFATEQPPGSRELEWGLAADLVQPALPAAVRVRLKLLAGEDEQSDMTRTIYVPSKAGINEVPVVEKAPGDET